MIFNVNIYEDIDKSSLLPQTDDSYEQLVSVTINVLDVKAAVTIKQAMSVTTDILEISRHKFTVPAEIWTHGHSCMQRFIIVTNVFI